MDNIIAKRQLRWIGKMARMDETRLPIKMLSCWINSPRPSRRPHTTIRNSMVKSLQILDREIAHNGNLLTNWFHIAKERSEWNEMIETLDSNDDFIFRFDDNDEDTNVDKHSNPSNLSYHNSVVDTNYAADNDSPTQEIVDESNLHYN
jgi:hypothetical protein